MQESKTLRARANVVLGGHEEKILLREPARARKKQCWWCTTCCELANQLPIRRLGQGAKIPKTRAYRAPSNDDRSEALGSSLPGCCRVQT